MLKKLRTLHLRSQLSIAFFLLIGMLFLVTGVYIDWRVQQVVEREIGEKLMATAQFVARQAAEFPVLRVVPGDETSRTLRRLGETLQIYTDYGGISRIVIADPQFRVYFDSRGEIGIGEEYIRFRFDANEIGQVLRSGETATSTLFTGRDGEPFKAGYASLENGGEAAAIVCVEGSAAALTAVREMRQVLFTFGLLSVLGSTLVAIFLARQITGPLEKLTRGAEAIGRGTYSGELQQSGSREVEVLAATLEEMRRSIAQRHQRMQMMLAGIAHEIRNPLGGIELFAGLLQKQSDGAAKLHAEKISGEVRHLKQIVSDFLDYARPPQPRRQVVRLAGCVDEVRASLPDDGIAWQVDLSPALAICTDPDHLRRMLDNLLRNACEALQELPDGRIRVTAQRRSDQVDIDIEDNGPGIAADIVDSIFEPFFTTRHTGTGLGLALVRLLAEENGGAISLVRHQDGCLFRLTLPAAQTGQNRPAPAPAKR